MPLVDLNLSKVYNSNRTNMTIIVFERSLLAFFSVLLDCTTYRLKILFVCFLFHSWDEKVLGLVPVDEKSLWLVGENYGAVRICLVVRHMKKKNKKNVRTLTEN